jgi:hypothetical protein
MQIFSSRLPRRKPERPLPDDALKMVVRRADKTARQ